MAFKHLLLAAFVCLPAVYCQESAASPAQIAYAISQNYDQTGPGAQTEQTSHQSNPTGQQHYSSPYNNLQQQQVYSHQQLQPVYSQQLTYSQPQSQYPGIQSLVGRYQTTHSQPQIYQAQPQTHHIQPQAYYAQSSQLQSHLAQPQTHSVQISHVQPTHPQVSYSHLSPAYSHSQPSQVTYKDYSPQIKYTQIPQTHIPQVKIAEPSTQYSQSYVMLQGVQPISKGQYSLVDTKPVVEQQTYVAPATKTAYSSPVSLKTVYQAAPSRPSLGFNKFSLPAQQYSYSH